MIAASFLSLLLQAAAPSAAPAPAATPAETALARENFPTLFLYYRLRYFHDISALLRCARVDADRAQPLNARYDALHHALVARFGAAVIDQPDRDPLQPSGDVDCGINALGYGNALTQLERHLAGTAR